MVFAWYGVSFAGIIGTARGHGQVGYHADASSVIMGCVHDVTHGVCSHASARVAVGVSWHDDGGGVDAKVGLGRCMSGFEHGVGGL